MRTIRIKYIGEANRLDKVKHGYKMKYTVPIGNGYTGFFTSKRAAGKFIGEVNSFLSLCFLNLNRIYGSVFVEFRNIWPLLEHDRRISQLGLREIERAINQQLSLVDNRLNFIPNYQYREGSGPNYYIMNDLRKICNALESVSQDIIKVHRSRSNSVDALRVQALAIETQTILKNLNQYGHNELEIYTYDESSTTILKAIS